MKALDFTKKKKQTGRQAGKTRIPLSKHRQGAS